MYHILYFRTKSFSSLETQAQKWLGRDLDFFLAHKLEARGQTLTPDRGSSYARLQIADHPSSLMYSFSGNDSIFMYILAMCACDMVEHSLTN